MAKLSDIEVDAELLVQALKFLAGTPTTHVGQFGVTVERSLPTHEQVERIERKLDRIVGLLEELVKQPEIITGHIS